MPPILDHSDRQIYNLQLLVIHRQQPPALYEVWICDRARGLSIALLRNIRLGCKWLAETNALA